MEFIEKSKQFLSEANQELQRVTWPAKKLVATSTWVVIGLVFVIAIVLGLVDAALARLVRLVLG
ncbi:MAG: preprotein translocase subunit SecE [Deltaproteobacteria bacterium]|nr:preprotein translocase subunit SecE [Deltaproteobacteria bacterium]